MFVCLKQGADLHMALLMPLPLTVSCFSKIQIGFTFLVPAHLGSPGKRAVKRVCVCYSLPSYDPRRPQLSWAPGIRVPPTKSGRGHAYHEPGEVESSSVVRC